MFCGNAGRRELYCSLFVTAIGKASAETVEAFVKGFKGRVTGMSTSYGSLDVVFTVVGAIVKATCEAGHDDWLSVLDLKDIRTVHIVGCTFRRCESHDDVVILGTGRSSMSGCTFYGCSVSPERKDSAIVKCLGGVATIEGTTFQECIGDSLSLAGDAGLVTVKGCQFTGGTPQVSQVLIFSRGGRISFSDCCFTSVVPLAETRAVHITHVAGANADVVFEVPICFDRSQEKSVSFSQGKAPWEKFLDDELSVFNCDGCDAAATWAPQANGSSAEGAGGGGLSGGETAGIVIGVLVAAAAVVVVVVVVLILRRQTVSHEGGNDRGESGTETSQDTGSTVKLGDVVTVMGSLWLDGGVATQDGVEDKFKGRFEEASDT